MRVIVIDGCLAIACATTLFAVVAMLVIPDFYERLHYLSIPSTFGIFFLTLAIVVHRGATSDSLKVAVAMGILVVINPIVTHATARAARVHQLGQWMPKPEEKVEIVGTDRTV